MKKQSIWISYDLGIKGDYPNLYKWLDLHKAKECGNSVAHFSYDYNTDILSELAKDLKDNIDFNPGDRIYAVAKVQIDGNDTFAGKYIIGNRKSNPWEGYAPTTETSIDL